jgi:hypothetical protein
LFLHVGLVGVGGAKLGHVWGVSTAVSWRRVARKSVLAPIRTGGEVSLLVERTEEMLKSDSSDKSLDSRLAAVLL